MNFDLDNEQKSICQKLNDNLKDKLPLWEESLGSNDLKSVKETLLAAFKQVAATGYADFVFGSEETGAGAMVLREELARLHPPLYFSLEGGNGLLLRLVNAYGSEAQKEYIAPALASGRTLGSVALVEEHGNVEDNPLQTEARSSGDGIILSGRKNMVANGPVADWIGVACLLGGKPAFALLGCDALDPSAFSRLPGGGLVPSLYYSLRMDSTEASEQDLIGPFDTMEPLVTLRRWENEMLIGASLGIMRRSFDQAKAHAKEHQCGGRPLVAYQEVGFKLAEMLTLIHTAQLLAYRAAWMTATGDREAKTLIHCAKVFCAEAAESVSSTALKILGIQGYLGNQQAEHAHRQATLVQIGGTSSERARMKIGDSVLGAY